MVTSRVKVTRHRQVTIPSHIALELGVEEGDVLLVESHDKQIIMRKVTADLPSFKLGRSLTIAEMETLIERSAAESTR